MPKGLFRLKNGTSISLRDRCVKRSRNYDPLTEAGKVKPKALDPAYIVRPIKSMQDVRKQYDYLHRSVRFIVFSSICRKALAVQKLKYPSNSFRP